MPIYEYRCPDCRSSFELLRPMTQSGEAAVCPKCGHTSTKAISRFACLSKDSSGTTTPVAGGRSCGSG
jgi:putative FmdB family regulatory protein